MRTPAEDGITDTLGRPLKLSEAPAARIARLLEIINVLEGTAPALHAEARETLAAIAEDLSEREGDIWWLRDQLRDHRTALDRAKDSAADVIERIDKLLERES